MNLSILHTEVQDFINLNLNADLAKMAFKGSPFNTVTIQELLNQVVSKRKCAQKLPTWFYTPFIYYPPKLHIEQTSSEITANYKASLITGNSIIDITGGFGVDCLYFSNRFINVTHCELTEELSTIAAYNFQLLNKNIKCVNVDGIEFLKSTTKKFDWIYIDPSRRNELKGKVFKLSDCVPNVPLLVDDLFKHTDNILLKVSPLLDISLAITELRFVSEVHIVAVANEVKELLLMLKKDFNDEIHLHTVNIDNDESHFFSFKLHDTIPSVSYASALTYLYEPNKAMFKAGNFNLIAARYNLLKLSKNTHLYTATELKAFPGYIYKVLHVVPYNYKKLNEVHPELKGTIKLKNFTDDIKTIKKKMKLTENADYFLFFITDYNEKPIILITEKVKII